MSKTNRFTAIILDDETKGRTGLARLLKDYCPHVEVVTSVSNGEEAYIAICKLRPQILFMDIEIAQAASGYVNSFELIPKLPDYNYEIIFVTAYEHYALQALRSHAIGYVLKPVSIEDLVSATDDAISKLSSSIPNRRNVEMANQISTNSSYSSRIWIHSNQDIIPINVKEIIRFEAQGKYTDIHQDEARKITSSKNLGEFEELLDPDQFIKIHRSHIINVDRISKFSKSEGGYVILSDNANIPVSRNGRERLMNCLK